MISLQSWWWPKRPARVPRAWAAGLLAALGAVLFGVSAVLLKTGTIGWDESLFRLLNDVPAAAASVLTPLSHLFLPTGIVIVIVLIIGYVLIGDRSRGRRRRMAAGACGQGHCRPPPALPGHGRRRAAPGARARHELSVQPH